ncbi:hypothetical protein [Hoeflea sp. IMCC20628]|uniref:hypothetical protein n=1 Tax=Hoeflea sp. IMCC20628 TaxID=1620421 RepID=UPI00063ADE58|nr:hypothetical protein [Hoeflea sp. IMCC20628]
MVLAACAGRPKPIDPTRPYTVTEVQVTAENIRDLDFAQRLQQRLEATAGRATSDIGQTSTLRVFVLDYGAETGLINFFDSSIRAASLNLVLVDANTGQVLRTSALRTTSARRNGQRAETVLVSRLVQDIRAMLGLSGTTPHPVTGTKRVVASPMLKPENLTDIEFLSADPLLNGTVTPTTMDFDLDPDAGPTLDISKPLLTAEPAAEEPVPAQTAAPSVSAIGPQMPVTAAESLPAESDGEPCIITLENECSDPDSQ